MDAELKLVQTMQVAAGRHTDLKAAFRKFRQAAREAFQTNVRYAPLPLSLGELNDSYKFSAEIAGRVIWLVLATRLDEGDNAVGQVSCFMQRMEGEGPPIILARFTLSKLGDTSLDDPARREEKINVFAPAPAAYVVLHCLRLALRRDWE